jgi:hypothetical protein
LVVGFSVSYFYFKPKIDTSPPWHPFELNSNIDLKSLVEEGYRCYSTPCGQAQFIKIVGDTMIQYDVSSIDCNTYEGRYDPSIYELEYEEIIQDTISSSNSDASSKSETVLTDSANHFSGLEIWKERHKKNPYYPYDIEEVEDCYQGIDWRVFQISMNNIDSIRIVDYIRKKGGFVITEYQNWNSSAGGDFLVYHDNTDLYFRCSISKDEYYTLDSTKNWTFTIVRSIPHLDQQRQKLEKQREEKRFQYYSE